MMVFGSGSLESDRCGENADESVDEIVRVLREVAARIDCKIETVKERARDSS